MHFCKVKPVEGVSWSPALLDNVDGYLGGGGIVIVDIISDKGHS